MSLHIRDAALLAEQAWNSTKAREDPEWSNCQHDHKTKLLAVIESLEKGAPSGIAGLEAYEAEVAVLLADLPPVEEAPLLLEAAKDDEYLEGDLLPEDFPGYTALRAAGITTYTGVREIEDLTTISGIGEATAAKIAEALEEE